MVYHETHLWLIQDPKESKNDCVVKEDDSNVSNNKCETIINNTEQIPENVTMTQEAQQNGVDSYYQELSNQIMSSVRNIS